MNPYEMTYKSNSSSGGSTNLLGNMKALIVHQDQKIQEKLKALNDLKETMTQPSAVNHGISSKESFHRTRILQRANFEEDYQDKQVKQKVPSLRLNEREEFHSLITRQHQQNQDESRQDSMSQEDMELKKLREKYLDQGTLQKYNEISGCQYETKHYRNKSYVDIKPHQSSSYNAINNTSQRSYQTQMIQGSDLAQRHQRRESVQINMYSNDRKEALNKLFLKHQQVLSPMSQTQIESNIDQRDTCYTQEDMNRTQEVMKIQEDKVAYNQEKMNAPLRFPIYQTPNHQPNTKEVDNRSYYSKLQETLPEHHQNLTELMSNHTNRTNCTQSDITQPINNKYISQTTSTKPPQIMNQSLLKSPKYPENELNQTNNLDLSNDLSAIKSAQRDQSQIMSKLQDRLDRSDNDLSLQISKSVERITSDLQVLKQQIAQQKQEEDSRYHKLAKDIKQIKHYYKKSKSRHSKKQLIEQESKSVIGQNQQVTETTSSNSNAQSKQLTHVNSDIHQVYNPVYQPQILNYNQMPQKYQRAQSQDFQGNQVIYSDYQRSETQASLNRFMELEKQVQFEKDIKQINQKENPKAHQMYYHQEALTPEYNHYPLKKQEQDHKVYYDFQTLSQQDPNFQAKNPILQNHPYDPRNPQNQNHHQSQKHTISFNTELEKVRGESNQNINDLKSFYETQLRQMRDEFQHREIIMKDKMKSQIQESMAIEKDKLNLKLQEFERDKHYLQAKLQSQSRSDNATNVTAIHSKTQSLTSFVSENITKSNRIEQPLGEITNSIPIHHPTQKHYQPDYKSIESQDQKKLTKRQSESLKKAKRAHTKENSMIMKQNLDSSLLFNQEPGNNKNHNNKALNQTHNLTMLQPNFNSNTGFNNSKVGAKNENTKKKRREKHEKNQSIGNMSQYQQMNQIISQGKGYSSQGKENHNMKGSGPKQIINEKDDKLLMKEKEILRRINKIESFLKKP
eukprot:403335967